MTTCLISVAISDEDPSARQALFGEEAAHLERLHREGTLSAALLSGDATTAWLVLDADTEDEVVRLISGFPLAAWFEITSIEPVRLLQPRPGT